MFLGKMMSYRGNLVVQQLSVEPWFTFTVTYTKEPISM